MTGLFRGVALLVLGISLVVLVLAIAALGLVLVVGSWLT